MKKIYLLALSAIFGVSAMAQVSVTFQVDMNDQTVSPDGVHIAGDFQEAAGIIGDPMNWNPGSAEMTEGDIDGIYSLTVDLPVGWYEYKFVNGNAWGSDEGVPNINKTGISDNRFIVVTDWHANAENMPDGFVIPAVLFNGSAPAGEVAVRLEVDMTATTDISENGVHVAGNLFSEEWEPGFGAMFPSNNNKYVYVANVDPNATYLYKFINGNEWGADEWSGQAAPEECTDEDGNRTLSVEEADVSLEAVCYESCSTCAPLTEVTFRVNMALQDVGTNVVSVAGSYQGWGAGDYPMTDDDGDDIYEITMMFEQGTHYYKFINGSTYETVPLSCRADGNREIVVGEDPITIEYCFNQCTVNCVPEPAGSDITFRVNMMNETVTDAGVWVMGSFTSPDQWQDGAVEMTDTDGDGIYKVTVDGVLGTSEFEYKFANGEPHAVEEDGDFAVGGCGAANGIGGFNRIGIRVAGEMLLDVVCYNSCDDCIVGLVENVLGNVSIFPNPSTGTTYIEVQNPNNYTLKMSIVDITGKTVRENVILNATVNEVNTTNLSSGLYFLNIVNEHNDQSVYKLMVR